MGLQTLNSLYSSLDRDAESGDSQLQTANSDALWVVQLNIGQRIQDQADAVQQDIELSHSKSARGAKRLSKVTTAVNIIQRSRNVSG